MKVHPSFRNRQEFASNGCAAGELIANQAFEFPKVRARVKRGSQACASGEITPRDASMPEKRCARTAQNLSIEEGAADIVTSHLQTALHPDG
ncbi:MAG: hypothetical protein WA681_05140, partial [Candidatus Acidiferrales bacterium]